jgi:hypothetical protein
MKKGISTKLVLNRDTMVEIVTQHVKMSMIGEHDVSDYKAHKDGSVEVRITKKEPEPELPLGGVTT